MKKKIMHSSDEAPQLELKLLPGGLKYANLGPDKLNPRWDGPFIVREVFNHGAIVVKDPRDGRILKVNEKNIKTILRGSYTRGGDYVTGDPCLLGCYVNSERAL